MVKDIKKSIKKDFKNGIENDEFKIFLQPKIDIVKEKIVGAEALIRRQKKGKIIMPNTFIVKYEKTNLITDLNLYVFENVCIKLKEWKEQQYKIIPIAINKSIKDLCNDKYIRKLENIIKKYNIEPQLIELELTENIVIENIELAKKAEKNVRNIGCIVSMDDFGVGYSSFQMLKNIKIDILKIDKSFLEEILKDKRGQIILESIINMSKKLNIKTVVEGIETKEQVEYLKSIGCDIVQGYYYEKPIPIEEFENKYIRKIIL